MVSAAVVFWSLIGIALIAMFFAGYEFGKEVNNDNSYAAMVDVCQIVHGYNSVDEAKDNLYFGFNGIAIHDNFYCVLTAGRSEWDISNTDLHESCHILIKRNKEHFCRGEY